MEPDLINKLKDQLSAIIPMPAAFNPDFIAANQSDRVDNIIKGTNQEVINQLWTDIQNFKKKVD